MSSVTRSTLTQPPPRGGDGTAWKTAFDNLHDGLAAAAGGGEVWVAEGTYDARVNGHRFQIPSGVAVFGGFVGIESSVDQRDWVAHPTVLTDSFGDIGIVGVSGGTVDTVLDGVSIEGVGWAGETFPNVGGKGISVVSSSLTVRHCRVFNNVGGTGGGVFINNDATNHEVAFVDCRIERNSTDDTGEGMCPNAPPGGGVYIRGGKATFIDCAITGNSAAWPGQSGGGIHARRTDLTLINCVVMDNSAGGGCGGSVGGGYGGGIYFGGQDQTTLEMYGCLVSTNGAGEDPFGGGRGGGVYVLSGVADIANCTFVGNGQGGGVTFSSAVDVSVSNSIVWGNSSPQLSGAKAPGIVTYSNVGAMQPDPTHGIISEDPRFVDSLNGDHHLTAGSPSVDAGGNTSFPMGIDVDLDGRPRFIDDPFTPNTGVGEPPVDMGAYELMLGDAQDDGDVDLFDFAGWDDCVTGADGGPYVEGCRSFDFDGDLDVDLIDFAGLQLAFTGTL